MSEGAGVLVVPDAMRPYAESDAEFMGALMKAMTRPIADESAPGTTLPFIVAAPDPSAVRFARLPSPWDALMEGF